VGVKLGSVKKKSWNEVLIGWIKPKGIWSTLSMTYRQAFTIGRAFLPNKQQKRR